MKNPIISIVCMLAVPIALGAVGVWWFQARFLPIAFTEDAVEVIGHEASRMFQDDPATSQGEIEQMIKSRHDASVINLKVDSDGKSVDPFGTALRVQHQIVNGKAITCVMSAGPDREFGTGDDIGFKHERERETKPQGSLPASSS